MRKHQTLTISDDLALPLDFVVATDGIFATKGMGKSHLAQVIAEEMLAIGQPIVAIDPTDAWWGLRSSTDGMHDGYPVVVVGGDHGDIPLDPNGAAQLAQAIVSERFSCVICTDGLGDTAEAKYVRVFLDTLYRKNREPLHIFIDEADVFAPQKPFEVEDSRCIRAMAHVVRRGRRKGLGTTLITQRPAELARAAWGTDLEHARLWSNLNLTICMWLYRRLVITAYSASVKKITGEIFKKCLMSVAADGTYHDYLLGRNLRERDRSPTYSKVKAIFAKRIEDEEHYKPRLPSPEWGGR